MSKPQIISEKIHKSSAEILSDNLPFVPDETLKWEVEAVIDKDDQSHRFVDGNGNRLKHSAKMLCGSFSTIEEANAYVRDVNARGFNKFDLHIVRRGRWAPFPPPKNGANVKYTQEHLGPIMTQYAKHYNKSESLLKKRLEQDRAEEETIRGSAKKKREEHKNAVNANPQAEVTVGKESKATKKKRKQISARNRNSSRQNALYKKAKISKKKTISLEQSTKISDL